MAGPDKIQDHLGLLGYRCRDLLTRFEGVVTSISFDVNGCVQALVLAGHDDKGGRISSWFDTKSLEKISHGPLVRQPNFIDVPGGRELPRFASRPTK